MSILGAALLVGAALGLLGGVRAVRYFAGKRRRWLKARELWCVTIRPGLVLRGHRTWSPTGTELVSCALFTEDGTGGEVLQELGAFPAAQGQVIRAAAESALARLAATQAHGGIH